MPQATAAPKPPLKTKYVALIVAGIVLLVPPSAIGVWLLTHEPPLPVLTRDGFNAARRKWEAAKLSGYDMDLLFYGGNDARKEIHVEVRNNRVTKYLENGISHDRATSRWTVPEQFELIADDLNRSEKPGGFNTRDNVTITLYAEFDPELGHPQTYIRAARGKTPLSSTWNITKFEPIPPLPTPGPAK